MNTKNNIDANFIKNLISEDLLYFFIASQISSDNILEKSNIEDRLRIIKSIKCVMDNLDIEGKDEYLDLLSDCEEILLNDLNDIT